MKPLLNLLSALLVMGLIPTCKNKESAPPISTRPGAAPPVTGCYLAVLSRDSIWMKLTIEDQVAEGDLMYNFYEKDKSKGRLTGTLHGDTLFANYIFSSEGMESIREVAFLKKGNDWIEGYGEMDPETGARFKNKPSLDFNNETILKPVACQ